MANRLLLGTAWAISIIGMFLLGKFVQTPQLNLSYFRSPDVTSAVQSDSPATTEGPLLIFSGSVCTPDIFRQYYRTMDYFPTEGEWTEATETTNETFVPGMCSLAWTEAPGDYILNITKDKEISSYLVMGDVNAKRIYQKLVELMSRVYRTCSLQKEERKIEDGFVLDENCIFGGKSQVLLSRVRGLRRPCNTCLSQVRMCHGRNHQAAKLEYVPLFSIDHKTARSKDHQIDKNMAWQTSSFLNDFIGYFLPRKMPSVLIFNPPFNLLTGENAEKVRSDIKGIVHVIQSNVPVSTKVFWIPALGELQNEMDQTTRLSVEEMNAFLFQELKASMLIQPFQRYGLFDLGYTNMSYAVDNTRLLDVWSENVVNIMVQMMLEGD